MCRPVTGRHRLASRGPDALGYTCHRSGQVRVESGGRHDPQASVLGSGHRRWRLGRCVRVWRSDGHQNHRLSTGLAGLPLPRQRDLRRRTELRSGAVRCSRRCRNRRRAHRGRARRAEPEHRTRHRGQPHRYRPAAIVGVRRARVEPRRMRANFRQIRDSRSARDRQVWEYGYASRQRFAEPVGNAPDRAGSALQFAWDHHRVWTAALPHDDGRA